MRKPMPSPGCHLFAELGQGTRVPDGRRSCATSWLGGGVASRKSGEGFVP